MIKKKKLFTLSFLCVELVGEFFYIIFEIIKMQHAYKEFSENTWNGLHKYDTKNYIKWK